jgi:hypothetical protein
VLAEEKIVRNVVAMWAGGDSTLASKPSTHCSTSSGLRRSRSRSRQLRPAPG